MVIKILFHVGFVSMLTLCVLAVCRLGSYLQYGRMNGKVTSFCAALQITCAIWLCAMALSLPPLFGWGRYVPEISGLG